MSAFAANVVAARFVVGSVTLRAGGIAGSVGKEFFTAQTALRSVFENQLKITCRFPSDAREWK